ncbi:MAG TPA: FecR domain-containing protein [Steroidobacter sp.]|uniref:FecR family protein n=1 Tax=Steroidobacter sp. TaxID=1978227 RepID=UPI002ED94D44
MTHLKESGLTDRPRQDELLKVAEQAAAWLIELEDGGVRERAACAAWLEESPLHVEMFLRAGAVDRLPELMAPNDVKALVQKNWGEDSSVVELPRTLARDPRASRPPARREMNPKARWGGIAAAVLLLVAGGVWFGLLGPGSWESYETQVGEQRVVSLADGSMIYVNTDSQVDVRYTQTARDVRLRNGEALFKVERDVQRPFQVQVGDTVVRAVGTEFNVYRRSTGTKVAVVEGLVQVFKSDSESSVAHTASTTRDAPIDSSPNTERLAAGQGVSLDKDGTLQKPTAVNVAQVTAWRQRRLVFEWQTLEEITAEFNRYNRAPKIRVEGEEIRRRRYTAVFDADNPQTLLKFLSKDDHLKFSAEGDDFVIRAR